MLGAGKSKVEGSVYHTGTAQTVIHCSLYIAGGVYVSGWRRTCCRVIPHTTAHATQNRTVQRLLKHISSPEQQPRGWQKQTKTYLVSHGVTEVRVSRKKPFLEWCYVPTVVKPEAFKTTVPYRHLCHGSARFASIVLISTQYASSIETLLGSPVICVTARKGRFARLLVVCTTSLERHG